MEWRGKRFGEYLAFRRTYDLDIYRYVSDIYNKFFEELNHHIKRHLERYYFKNDNNDWLDPIGGEYEKPWIFKDCGNIDCVRTAVTHTTAGTGGV